MEFSLEKLVRGRTRKPRKEGDQYCKSCHRWVESLEELLVKFQGWFDLCENCKQKIIQEEEAKVYSEQLNKRIDK
jgi:hypothetical protein